MSQKIIQEKEQFQTSDNDNKHTHESQMRSSSSTPTLSEKNRLVLAVLVRGSITFESIKKNTGISNKELDEILENLEKYKLLKVQQKKGLLGIKIELHPTDKGLKEYSSF